MREPSERSTRGCLEGLLHAPYPSGQAACRQVDLHPASGLALAVWGDQISVRDVARGGERVVADLTLPEGVICARFSPDGEQVLVGTRQDQIALLDWRCSRVLVTSPRLGDAVDQLCWLAGPDRWFFAASRSGELVVYDGRTLQPRVRFSHPSVPCAIPGGLAAAPHGRWIYLAGGASVRCLGLPRGQCLWRHEASRTLEGLAVSPDGRYLAAATDERVAILDATDGEQRACSTEFPFRGIRFPGGSIAWSPRVAFAADGRHLAASTPNGQLLLLRTEDLTPMRIYPRWVVAWVEDLAWLADGERLLVGCADDRLRVVSLAGNRCVLDVSVSGRLPLAGRP